jgi:hypothetical protein
MIFHSRTYLAFLALVLALYWSLPRRGQNLMLILASYIFYGWEHPWFLLPLWASTVVDYSCALGMERFPRQRRALLVTSIAASIALLATFKYYDFALENVNAILANFGQDPLRNTLRLALYQRPETAQDVFSSINNLVNRLSDAAALWNCAWKERDGFSVKEWTNSNQILVIPGADAEGDPLNTVAELIFDRTADAILNLPEAVTMLSCAPGRLPNSAPYVSLTTANSQTASTPRSWPLVPPGVLLTSEALVNSTPLRM